MSLPNGHTETPAQPRSAQDDDESSFAPKRARDGGARRKLFPLRLPFTPVIHEAGASSASIAAAARAAVPDLLAPDMVLKRLLGPGPAPQPLLLQPLRDPVGQALGVLARLIVAGCAAAALTMLLLGTIPRSVKVVAPAAKPTPATTAAASPTLAAVPQHAGEASAPAAQPARVATISVRAPQGPAAAGSTLDAEAVTRLVKRGEEYLARGDIAAARLIFGRAADTHDAGAALAFAATYDPEVLRRLNVLGVKPDIGQARAWYAKAADYGSAEAARRLAVLQGPDE